jgi:hypothetical protein
MLTGIPKDAASVGVSDHWGWAVLVTVGREGALIDRRRVELVGAGLPKYPYHHDAQGLPLDQAEALIERVARSAGECAAACLAALAASVPVPIATIALRVSPVLPATVAERLSNYQAQNVADSVLYRDALAQAAAARGWSVYYYDARNVAARAAGALGRKSIQELVEKTGAALGPPWQKDHKLAMAAALAARAS